MKTKTQSDQKLITHREAPLGRTGAKGEYEKQRDKNILATQKLGSVVDTRV